MSPITPPPTATATSVRVTPARTISVQMISAWATVFDCSPGVMRIPASVGSNSSP